MEHYTVDEALPDILQREHLSHGRRRNLQTSIRRPASKGGNNDPVSIITLQLSMILYIF